MSEHGDAEALREKMEQAVVDLRSREISAVEESLENVNVLAFTDQWGPEKVVQVYDPSDR
ncbi:MAG: hypothetical protein OEW84_08655 [Aigarchaeota archaeon]|nr:hypothetical protein [Aigarchaeota archaeon]